MLKFYHNVKVRVLKDREPFKAGEIVAASVYPNLDAYEPCAEVPVEGREMAVMLGRLEFGGWEFVDAPPFHSGSMLRSQADEVS